MKKSEVVRWFLGPANEQTAKAVKPAMGALDDPAACFLAGRLFFFGGGFLATRADVGDKAESLCEKAYLLVVITFVQTKMLERLRARSGRVDGNA